MRNFATTWTFELDDRLQTAFTHQFVREDNRCIYNIDKDTVDVQNVSAEYKSGAIANFMLNFNCMGSRAGRNFHAVGTKGRIWGNLNEKTVFFHENFAGQTSLYDASGDGSGHGGGDRLHALLLGKMKREPRDRPGQGAKAGYLSAVVCFAADLSLSQQRRIDFAFDPYGLVHSYEIVSEGVKDTQPSHQSDSFPSWLVRNVMQL